MRRRRFPCKGGDARVHAGGPERVVPGACRTRGADQGMYPWYDSASQAQALDKACVTGLVLGFDIIEQAPALADHDQQAAS